MMPASWRAGEQRFSRSPWAVRAPDQGSAAFVTFVTKLHGGSRVAFRVDVASAVDLGKLVALSGDPAYLGYPYPLALAHNAALVPEEETEDVRRRIYEATRTKGLAEHDWNLLFEDYHDVLELGA